MSKTLITQDVVLSYPHFDEPVEAQNGEGRSTYSVSLLYAPGADLTKEREAVMQVAVDQFGEKAAQMLKSGQIASPFRTDWEAKGYPEGTVFINVRRGAEQGPPGMVYPHRDPATGKPALVVPGLATVGYVLSDADKRKIREVFYGGVHARVSISAFFYNFNNMKKGISFGLNNVQKLADGVRLDGRKSAQDEFEPTEELEPADLSALEGA